MSAISLGELEATLRDAANLVDTAVAPVVRATANKMADTQRSTVTVRTGRTRDSIKATGPNGTPFTPTTIEAEVGPTWFVGKFEELGTVNRPPRPFVATSYEPHRAAHEQAVLGAVASRALGRLTS